jgi:hypothetical protein
MGTHGSDLRNLTAVETFGHVVPALTASTPPSSLNTVSQGKRKRNASICYGSNMSGQSGSGAH